MTDIRTLSETRSTNDDVAALAREGAPEGLWLRADRQTGGRGRQGRGWHSPPGNLHASTLVRLREGDPPAPTLALVAAVALHEAVTLFARDLPSPLREGLPSSPAKGAPHPLMIKWPNDILAGRAKLAGILLERGGDAVVIGFGVNLASHPRDLDRPVTSLAALAGVAPDPALFLERLADTMSRWVARWRSGGLAPIRTAWLSAAHPIGTAIATPDGEGLFDGLDEGGGLRLRLADGALRIIRAGDVFLV